MWKDRIKNFIIPIGKSYSAIFFTPSFIVGMIILLATMLNPNLGGGGIIALLSAYLVARWLGLKREFLQLDYYIYNPLLVGLAAGYLFKLTFSSILFIILLGILTFFLTYSLSVALYYYFRLPVLSVPFVIVSSIAYLAALRYTDLFVYNLYPHTQLLNLYLPPLIDGFFRSLGAIFFTPDPLLGILYFLLLLSMSRILSLLAIISYLSGTLVKAAFVGSLLAATRDINAFNYILIGFAIGGVFLIPSPTSYLIAAIASAVAVPIVSSVSVLWESYAVPIFAIPFNFVSYIFIYVLGNTGYRWMTRLYRGSPEKTLDYFLTTQRRFDFTGREIALPFSGEWSVWQSFDGEWTHKGNWKYSVDFVIRNEKEKTFTGDGKRLIDYYAFGKQIFSPVDGQVIKAIDTLPDNPPGEADKDNYCGNHIIIYDNRGFYVVICHLKYKSLKVKEGERVKRGTILAQCGNSGYSPQPHIHIHVQLLPEIGSVTVPFKFHSYVSNETRFVDAGVPVRDEKVESLFPDKALRKRLNLLLDDSFSYIVNGKEELNLQVKMAPDGTFYLSDGKDKLFFGIINNTFYIYSYEGSAKSPLKLLFLAASKIPLVYKEKMEWEDTIPLTIVEKGLKREIKLFLSSFKHDMYIIRGHYTWEGNRQMAGTITSNRQFIRTSLIVAEDRGFEEIRVHTPQGELILKRRREDEKDNGNIGTPNVG